MAQAERERAPYSASAVVFETERVLARGYSLDDLEATFEMYRDPEMLRFLGGATPSADLVQHRAWLAGVIQRSEALAPGMGSFAVVDLALGQVVGTAIFRPSRRIAEPLPDEIELGWHVARRVWGRGFGAEIGRGLIGYGVSLGFQRMIALIDPGNVRSASVARRVGMREVGSTRAYEDGEPCQLWEMAR